VTALSPSSKAAASPRRWLLVAPLALALGFLAFGQAAANLGMPIGVFAGLGPAFYAWKPAHFALEAQLRENRGGPPAAALIAAGEQLVTVAPLSIDAWRAVGLGRAALGHGEAAARAMRVAHRLSRHDALVEAWLIDDAVRRNDNIAALDHYDSLLRILPQAYWPLLTRLAMAQGDPRVRMATLRYADAQSPWFGVFITIAAQTMPKVAPLVDMLLATPVIPDSPALRSAYGVLVQRLATEGAVDQLSTIYARLPGARARDLASVGLDGAGVYPPFQWQFVSDNARAASLVTMADKKSLAIEASADVFAEGVVASRQVALPPRPHRFSWHVITAVQDDSASAVWRLDCKGAGLIMSSDNLLNAATPKFIDIPAVCQIVRVDLMLDGGRGAHRTRLQVGALALRPINVSRTGNGSGAV
jgi:hypothetical protein